MVLHLCMYVLLDDMFRNIHPYEGMWLLERDVTIIYNDVGMKNVRTLFILPFLKLQFFCDY